MLSRWPYGDSPAVGDLNVKTSFVKRLLWLSPYVVSAHPSHGLWEHHLFSCCFYTSTSDHHRTMTICGHTGAWKQGKVRCFLSINDLNMATFTGHMLDSSTCKQFLFKNNPSVGIWSSVQFSNTQHHTHYNFKDQHTSAPASLNTSTFMSPLSFKGFSNCLFCIKFLTEESTTTRKTAKSMLLPSSAVHNLAFRHRAILFVRHLCLIIKSWLM